jgi:large subunit ribosomal protein L25
MKDEDKMAVTLEAVRREGFGKGPSRRLRQRGRIPAVLYGGPVAEGQKPESVPISVHPKDLMRILHSDSGANTLISLTFEGVTAQVMIREYQLDPVTHHPLHTDFYRVALDKPVAVTVPLVLKGEARGVKQQGGIVDFVHREIEIECLPADIPEHVEVDISELVVGQGIRLRELVESAKWRPVSDLDTLLVHVIMPRAVEEEPVEAVAAPAAPAEPEIIKKGKVEKPEEEEKAQ